MKLNKEQQITIIFSTHDPVLVEQVKPRIIRLENGEVLFDKKNINKEEAFAGLL